MGQVRLSKYLDNESISGVDCVILMCDRDTRHIVLKPSENAIAYAHRLSHSSGGKQVSAVQFFKTYGIELTETSLRLACQRGDDLGAYVVEPIPEEALSKN